MKPNTSTMPGPGGCLVQWPARGRMDTSRARSAGYLALLLLLTLTALLTNSQTIAATLFFDDFNTPSLAGSVNETIWRLPTGPGTFFGRTQIKPPSFQGQNLRPIVDGGTVTLQLDTYNASGPDSFWGHEIQTRQTFTPGPTGISIQSRMRYVGGGTPAGGLIGGFFTWALDSNDIRDEIDFELLTNDLGNEEIFTNVYDGKNFNQLGIGSNVSVPGFDMTGFNTYEIRWFADSVQWLVNGTLIREQLGVQLDRPSEVRINLWVPNEGFQAAYNPLLFPAFSEEANEEYALEIDFVRVSTVPVPPAMALFASAIALLGFARSRSTAGSG